jgi:hypothetical protein
MPVRRMGDILKTSDRSIQKGAKNFPVWLMNSTIPKQVACICWGKVSTTKKI